jgi:hypothetical protein
MKVDGKPHVQAWKEPPRPTEQKSGWAPEMVWIQRTLKSIALAGN